MADGEEEQKVILGNWVVIYESKCGIKRLSDEDIRRGIYFGTEKIRELPQSRDRYNYERYMNARAEANSDISSKEIRR